MLALWISSLYPIVRNTFSGVRDAEPRAVAAARARGVSVIGDVELFAQAATAPVLAVTDAILAGN